MVILVYKTSLESKTDVQNISNSLNSHPQIEDWSVDLEDWERILRIKVADKASELGIAECVRSFGYSCEHLDH